MQDQQETVLPFLSEPDSKLYQYKVKMEQVKTELLKFSESKPSQNLICLGKYGSKKGRSRGVKSTCHFYPIWSSVRKTCINQYTKT